MLAKDKHTEVCGSEDITEVLDVTPPPNANLNRVNGHHRFTNLKTQYAITFTEKSFLLEK